MSDGRRGPLLAAGGVAALSCVFCLECAEQDSAIQPSLAALVGFLCAAAFGGIAVAALLLALAPKRWFRFSLRSLFVMLTMCGCFLGYELTWVRQRHAFVSSQQAKFQAMGFDMQIYRGNNRIVAPRGAWLIGESGVRKLPIVHPKDEAEREVCRARELFPEAKIMLMGEEPPAQTPGPTPNNVTTGGPALAPRSAAR